MNLNNSSKCDTLPKLMSSTHKLLEPTYIRNTQFKEKQETSFLPQIRASVNVPHTKQLVIQRLIHSLDFSTRNFGSACDRGFQALSNYHQSQKFGHSGTKLQPLNRKISADLTDNEAAAELPKDERAFFRKTYNLGDTPISVLVKAFEIDYVQDFDGEPDKKFSKQLSFHLSLQIYSSKLDPVEFFSKNLQILDKSSIAIRQKGLNALKTHFGELSDEPQQRLVTIKNTIDNSGFFRISFPVAQLYVQDCQHTQTIELSPKQLLDFVQTGFDDLSSLVEQFDFEKLRLYQQEQEEISQKLILESKKSQENAEAQLKAQSSLQVAGPTTPKPEPIVEQQQTSEQNIVSEQQKQVTVHIGLVISEEKTNFPMEVWKKKLIKKVARLNDVLYTVNFIPSQIQLREKVSQKVLKTYSPTLQELNSIFHLSQTIPLSQILDEYIGLVINLPPEAYQYSEFKKGIQIAVKLPILDPVLEITQENSVNGLFSVQLKNVEVNNKDLEILLLPSCIEIYEQKTCYIEKRICRSQDLNKILSHQFCVTFKLV